MRKSIGSLLVALCLATLGCDTPSTSDSSNPDATGGGDDGGTTGGPPTGGAVVPMVTVSGSVVDFQTGAPVTGSAAVSVNGVSPIPSATMTGSDFLLQNVEPFSVFYVIASSPPDYRSTYNPALKVDGSDVTGVDAQVVKESYVTSLASAFKVTPAAGSAILVVRATDGNGVALGGVPGTALAIAGAKGPFFLDAMKLPAPALTATSASGYAVFFDVPVGPVALSAPAASGLTFISAAAPAVASMVTLSTVTVVSSAAVPPPPQNVSFSTQIVPIFSRRGCTNCHSGNGPGRDLGGLTLDASVVQDWRNLTQQLSPNFKTTRVNLQTPEKSLVLMMPSYSNPPNGHPTVVFPSNADPDYQLILNWIKQGARQN